MKKILLLFVIILSSCSTDKEICKSTCSFAKTALDGSFFLVKVTIVPVDCETNKPNAETIAKVKADQKVTSFCCCD
jgi:hypothetical protein